VATAPELVTWLKKALLAKTHLQDDAAELAAHWALSTLFQPVLDVLPCLVVTGNADQASHVLHALHHFCPKPALLAGLQRSHLDKLFAFETLLVFEPNLQRRTADLLSGLTDKQLVVVNGHYWGHYAKSMAIYGGENPDIPKIQNSIHIHMTPTNAPPTLAPNWLQTMMERVPVHLAQYRNKNLSYVRCWTWVPSGLSSEMAAIATALGRGIVHAPELRQRLVALLKTQDQQRFSEMSNTTEAIVLEANRTLSRDGREQAYAREIAAEANRLLEARGETARLSPEKVGHVNKKLGLPTRRLSQTGNGLKFDKSTVAQIQQLAAVYVMEDMPRETENLHGSQAIENK
jgi:hypothetical protein